MDELYIKTFIETDFSILSESLSKNQFYTLAYVFFKALSQKTLFYFWEPENIHFKEEHVQTKLLPTLAFRLLCEQNINLNENIKKALAQGFNDDVILRPSNQGNGYSLIFPYSQLYLEFEEKALALREIIIERAKMEESLISEEELLAKTKINQKI